MKDLQQWGAVQEMHRCKVPIKEIARKLKMSKNTVKKLIRFKEAPKYTRNNYPSKTDPYKEKIIEWRLSPRYEYNGTRIYRELKKLGYTGSISPVYRTLSKIDENGSEISDKATIRVETPPGDQAQFDWSEYQIDVDGRIRTVYCFSMILAACRKKAICFSLTSDAEAIYEAIQELYGDLGGVTLELLIDNPKALVVENNPSSEEEIKYNPQALLVAKHLGTELNACPCYWPRKKGKIENPFRYIEEQFIKGNSFDSMEDLNKQGKVFIHDWNQQIHGTTLRIPDEFYEAEEKKALLPLPARHLILKTLSDRIISNDSYISIATNKYSLPVQYATKKVHYRVIYGFRIEVYDDNRNLIQTMEALDGRGRTLKDPEHYADIAPRASTSIPQIRRDFTAAFEHGAEYLSIADRMFQQPTHHARKILELLDLYDADKLDKIIAYGISQGVLDYKSFKKLLKDHYFDIVGGVYGSNDSRPANDRSDEGLTRSCDYYESQRDVISI